MSGSSFERLPKVLGYLLNKGKTSKALPVDTILL